jgi:DNA polymerase-3 subunit gamma/tau
MTYQAIARKWRPDTFDEIAGQDHVTRTLKNALRLGRIHHALLFTGARGVGKTTAARAMSRSLNCVNGPTPDPCGECTSCKEIITGASPDVVEIDGASNNSVNDVRELRDTVAYLPTRGKYRVYIIDEVHMLSQGAFTALLKTLEEPPAHVVFIFATTEPQKIPDTVLSRVQRFDFKRISASVVAGRLRTICDAEGVTISDLGLRTIARAGEGSMRDAQSLLDQVIAFGGQDISDQQVSDILGLVDREILYTMLEGLTGGDPGLCLDAIARVYDFGFEISQFTSELLELLRNATLVALSPSARKHVDAPEEELARLEQIAGGMSVDVLSRWFQVMLDVHDQIARSPYPRMVLEMAVARLAQARPVRPVDELLGRLEDLERGLRFSGAGPGGGPGGGPGRGGPGGSGRGSDARGGGGGPPRGAPRSPHDASTAPRSAPPVGAGDARRPTPPRADARPRGADLTPPPGPPRPPPLGEPVAPRTTGRAAHPPTRSPQTAPRASAGRPAGPRAQGTASQPRPDRGRGEREPADREPERPPLLTDPYADAAEPAPFAPQGDYGPADSGPSRGAPRPPSLTLHTDNEARYGAFLKRLRAEGLRYDVLIENSVFSGQQGETLRIAFPEGFILNRGRDLVGDPVVVSLARDAFPGVRRLEAVERVGGEGTTRKEARARRLERHRQSLWEEAKSDEAIRALCSALEATIEDVVPLSIPEED